MSKRLSPLHWIFLLLLSASLVVTSGCGKDKKGEGAAKSPTTVPYMHPDFRVALVIQPQQLLKSQVVTSITGKLPGDPVAEMTKEFREETGLELSQIKRVVLLANAFMPGGNVATEPDFDFGEEESGEATGSDEAEGAPEETGEDPGNGASLQRSATRISTFPVALQEEGGPPVAGSINANEEELFPEAKPFFCVVINVVDGVDLTATAEKLTAGKTTTKTGDHSYYPYTKDDDGPSVCIVDKTTLLLAEEPDLKKILETGNSETPLSKELANLESTNDISVVALVGDAVRDMGMEDALEQGRLPIGGIPAELAENASMAKDIDAVSIAINLSSETLLQVNMNTSNDEVAGKLTKQLDDAKKQGQESLAAMPGEGNPIAELGNAVMNGLSINNNAGRVTVALKMSQADLQKTVDMVMSFATMFGPGPGDFGPPPEAIEGELELPDEAGSDEPEAVELPPAKEADRP